MNTVTKLEQATKYLTVGVDIEVPGSGSGKVRDTGARTHSPLYGHGNITFYFTVKFELLPCGGRNSEGQMYAKWQSEPEAVLESCSALWEGNYTDVEDEVEDYSDEHLEWAKAEALKIAKSQVRNVRFVEER